MKNFVEIVSHSIIDNYIPDITRGYENILHPSQNTSCFDFFTQFKVYKNDNFTYYITKYNSMFYSKMGNLKKQYAELYVLYIVKYVEKIKVTIILGPEEYLVDYVFEPKLQVASHYFCNSSQSLKLHFSSSHAA